MSTSKRIGIGALAGLAVAALTFGIGFWVDRLGVDPDHPVAQTALYVVAGPIELLEYLLIPFKGKTLLDSESLLWVFVVGYLAAFGAALGFLLCSPARRSRFTGIALGLGLLLWHLQAKAAFDRQFEEGLEKAVNFFATEMAPALKSVIDEAVRQR